jgi:alpha-beta hydrolase superfamily lysophospholipase/SAM-dependent methyltransferase
MTVLQSSPPSVDGLAGVPDQSTFPAADGAELLYRHWGRTERGGNAIVLFHRGHEHSGRFAELAQSLDLPDCHFFAWDARGHGRSPGERGYADSFATVTADADQFIHHLQTLHGVRMQDMVVLGHSVGAVTVAAWVHDYAPPVRAMVLVTPALRVKLYVPLALPALRLRNRLGKSFIKSYVRAKALTHDPVQAKAYQDDPLISRNIATNILLDLHDTATRLIADAGAICTPTLVLSAGSDWVVKNSAQRKFFDHLGSPVKQMQEYPGFYHALLHERDRAQPIARIRQFIQQAFERTAEDDSIDIFADRAGYTHEEFTSLNGRLPALSPRRWNYSAQRISMKSLCRLSRGIRLGWETGFDSGQTLDYVYRNQASGTTPLGRLIDRQYLNSIGWAGTRVRKAHLKQMLTRAVQLLGDDGRPVRIVDIAGGGGRYVLEVLSELAAGGVGVGIEALIRDRSRDALAVGQQTAAELELKNVRFAEGDAFDAESLGAIRPAPTIAIVSGLYELFGDNGRVGASLAGLARALSAGAYLIYTNQPWHPQIEMIARVLINRDGEPWIMRRRTQREMDALVSRAGFEKLDMLIDKHGIFTVSLARRVER